MPRIRYVAKSFSAAHLEAIERANAIIDEYRAQGFTLTLRQLYYQFVARDLIANKQTEYKRLGGIVSDARLAGLLDWNSIEDRTRELVANSHWDSPASILESAAESYAEDKWAGQKWRPEVWIEKEALVGVVEPTCRELDVAFFACRGYNSQSEQWVAGRRMGARYRNAANPQRTFVLHFGDHDPSGLDMTKDNRERLELFAGAGAFELRRLALNRDQVDEYDPPPNPAKTTDSRFEAYSAEHGDESWELDALEPATIADLIRTAVLEVRDEDLWNEALEAEETARERLRELAEQEA